MRDRGLHGLGVGLLALLAATTLANPAGPAPVRRPATPAVSVRDARVVEGGAKTSVLVFRLTLSAASRRTVSVRYETADGSATGESGDYTPDAGTASFRPGVRTRTVEIAVTADNDVEKNETVRLLLSHPVNATIARATGIGTIQNDDLGAQMQVTGREQIVYDWSEARCDLYDMPDLPARAVRNSATGEVQIYIAMIYNRRLVGPDFDHLRHDCGSALPSGMNDDSSAFDDMEWIASVYSNDGRTVYALVHMEHTPGFFPANVPNYVAITLAVSTDGGRSYQHAAPPGHLVAAIPDQRREGPQPGGGQGIGGPTGIVRGPDGSYYTFAVINDALEPQKGGWCLLRTPDLADPRAWRGWNRRTGWASFVNPYREPVTDREAHLCDGFDGLNQALNGAWFALSSLTYNTYLQRYVLVGELRTVPRPSGFYFTTSTDLLHWTPPRLIAEEPLTPPIACSSGNPVQYPSLIDPASSSPSFDTVGQTAYLYYARHRCANFWERDLVRVPVRFTK